MHVDQANPVFEALDIGPSCYNFSIADVTKEVFTKLGSFDYLQGKRLGFAAAKLTDLSPLHSVRPEPSFVTLEWLGRSAMGNVRAVTSALCFART